MSNVIERLLLRNLQEVFGDGDPARRRAAIEELYTEDCAVHLPIGRCFGRAALDQIAGELRASHPNYVYTPHRAPQAVQDGGRLAWGSGPSGEPPRYTELDFHYRPRREDRRPICFPRYAICMMANSVSNTGRLAPEGGHRRPFDVARP
jgi:hypothetical protein